MELVHAFSLVHDDIIDLDERRRHRAALWKAYGAGPALLAGDALLALAVDRLAGTGRPWRTCRGRWWSWSRGRPLDLAFENRPWRGPGEVTVEEYAEMAAGKTGSLLGAAAATGVALGGAPELAERLGRWAATSASPSRSSTTSSASGAIRQITGKPVHGDLRRGKKTLPVLAALSAGGPAARELTAVVGAAATDEEAVRQAARLVEEAGGRQAALDLSARRARGAMKMMAEFLPGDTALRDVCGALIDRIADRWGALIDRVR